MFSPPDLSDLSLSQGIIKKDVPRSQLLLLDLRHCAKCTSERGTCSYSPQGCSEVKDLWTHVLTCNDTDCTMPRCQEAVQLLKHHQQCKQPCEVCTPARRMMDSIRTQPREVTSSPGQEDWGKQETILDRAQKINRTMEVLMHASACVDPECSFDSCSKVKQLFLHAVNCSLKAEGGCNPCRRLWGVLQLHSRQCRLRPCPVPRCQDLRAMAQRREAFRNARKEALSLASSQRKRDVGHNVHLKELQLKMQHFRTTDDVDIADDGQYA